MFLECLNLFWNEIVLPTYSSTEIMARSSIEIEQLENSTKKSGLIKIISQVNIFK